MTTIAVMQPYFFPYLGYFRLFSAADIFVFFDCVQFPRRGFVHRNRMPKLSPNGSDQPKHWLTLPIKDQPQRTLISELAFASGASNEWVKRVASFPWVSQVRRSEATCVLDAVASLDEAEPVADYVVRTVMATVQLLGINRQTILSSSLNVSPHLRGQDRILEIVRVLGGARYINAPGGRGLYDSTAFDRAGVELAFLPPFQGSSNSVLYELCFSDLGALRRSTASF